MPDFVEIDGVTHAYGGQGGVIAVDKLTLSIAEGEFAAVVGPSGLRQVDPDEARHRAAVSRRPAPSRSAARRSPARSRSPAWRSRRRACCPGARTLENILLPLEIVQPHRKRLRSERAAYIAKVEALLAQVGLAGMGAKYPWELSGGMQQRASLCRALIHEPRLLMLDEPFGALDSFTREELWCVMRDLHAARPVTIILVTHDLREAAFLADRIFCMSSRPGRIVAERRVDVPAPARASTSPTRRVHRHRPRSALADRQRLRRPR